MNFDKLAEYLLTGGVMVGLVELVKRAIERYWKKQDKKQEIPSIELTIKSISAIYDLMRNILEKTPYTCFMIFKAENGGGIPRVGAHLYVSALMEVHEDFSKTELYDYQRFLVDSSYASMLNTILADGHVFYKVAEMDNLMLKSIYNRVGIKQSSVHLLHKAADALYYCSLATDNEREITEIHNTEVELGLSRIKEILKNTIK